jgi:aldose 1-epimerase
MHDRQRYRVTSDLQAGVTVFSLLDGTAARAQIAPALGDNCFFFGTPEPVLEAVSLDALVERPPFSGIPILFPYPNRIRDGSFSFQGMTYTPAAQQHGLVRDKRWTVVGQGASDDVGAWLTCSLDARDFADEVLQGFPFPFQIEVTYRLWEGRLEMATVARNTGSGEMPLGFGIHPYFRRPERGAITIPARARWELADMLPTGRLLPVAGDFDLRAGKSLDGLEIDDIFTDIEADADGLVRCVLADHERGTELVVEFSAAQFRHVVVYMTPAPRRAIGIEPNTCPTDAFNLREQGIASDVIVLGPGESVAFTISMFTRPAGRS